ncbi:PAS domain S-box protein [Microvirga pudoricolor]|uniref:PAS domain S-box protein n=1 Tax=Microvirga pudoricolor TaxID=2778729 RepID=UPI0019520509|nr:PAS domain S-box protein [Microvirga pudoricolor]MBM6596651.1 PAS domain S-box protein [Microvirga pudoricolor]
MLVREIERGVGFVLVTDEAFRTADLKHLSRWIDQQPPWSDLAFIVLTMRGGGIERNPTARRFLDVLGNVSFLERPFHPTTLVSLADTALRARRRQYEARARLEALRESEARYRTLFENIDEGFAIIEFLDGPHGPASDYIHVEANPAYAIHAGIQNVVGQKVREMVPDEAEAWVALYRRVLETGEPTRFERELVATQRYLELAAFRVEPASRRQVAVVFRDVTARKQAELALRASEASLRALNADLEREVEERTRQRSRTWQVSPDLLGVASPKGYFTSSNPAWEQTLGWTQDEIARIPLREMLHPDDVGPTNAAFDKLRHGEPVLRFENRYRAKDGTYRWISWVAVPEGEEIYCSGRNVTVEKEQAVELAERQAELDRLWTLSEDMLARADYQGMMSAVSPAWTRVLGWTETELLARPYATFMHPDDMPPTLAALARMSEVGQPTRFENRIATQDGGWKPIEWTVAPEADGINFIAVGRDLSVMKAREKELAVAQEALRQSQKLEAVGQLTGGVAHDFNNLLTIIKSSTDFLRRPDLPEERRRRYVDAISDTVDRASKLTGQLLAFARRQALKPEVFDVSKRVEVVTDMLRTVVGSRIQIVTELALGDCFVQADVSQFETALVNMTVNARDAMDGEGQLTVAVRSIPVLPPLRGHAGSVGPFVALSVSDTGAGIPAEKLSQIFEPFFTTKEVGKGTGLGLSQVYGFVKQSGGDVAVVSEVGQGATFTIYLPQVEKVSEERSTTFNETAASAEGQGRRVLVVEDNIEVGRFSTQLLQDLGYVTTWAANAREALELLSKLDDFDAVFSDVVMPGMSGVELGEEIRRRYPGLPVILTSGYSHVLAEEGRHGFELLHKPYAADELARVLRRAIRHSGGLASSALR